MHYFFSYHSYTMHNSFNQSIFNIYVSGNKKVNIFNIIPLYIYLLKKTIFTCYLENRAIDIIFLVFYFFKEMIIVGFGVES